MIRFLFLLALAATLTAPSALAQGSWDQLGADIDGGTAGDLSGQSVSFSGDRVAIGAVGDNGNGSFAGHVRVYELSGGAWTQLGADIDGEATFDASGASVSLSGDRVAIGAPGNGGNGSFAGHVRVYEYDGTNWVQIGADIDGEAANDQSGSVSLSGDRVAIGAYSNDGNGTSSGHVRVYEYDGTNWVQIGADIDGEAAGDESGASISLSSSGDRVAIGARRNGGNGSFAGHVRVYEYDGTNWVQIGADIDGEAANDQSGASVSLSGDRVAIGAIFNGGAGSAAGHVRVYEYDGTAWVQLGADIDGEAAGDQSGWSVSLSGDRVAIGANRNDGTGTDAGHVRVYELSGGAWTQLGADIDGEAASDESGYSVSLSGDRVAIGAPDNDGTGPDAGHVRVYAFTAPPPPAYVYWANNNTNEIGRAEIDGSNPNQSFITGANQPRGITQDDQFVYWANTGGNTIGRANLDGTGVDQAFVSSTPGVYGLVVDKQFLYWTQSNNSIYRANLDGTGATPIVTGISVLGITVDARYLYWANVGGAIGRADRDGSNPNATFITGLQRPFGVAVNGEHIYWPNENRGGGSPGLGTIGRADLDGSNVNLDFITSGMDLPRGIAVSESHVYWPNFNGGTIGRADLDGTNANGNFVTGASGPFAVGTASAAALAGPTAVLTGTDGFRMLAHPAGGTVGDLLGSTRTQGFPGSDDPGATFCSVYTFSEATYSYSCVGSESATLPQGTGIYAYVYDDEDQAAAGVQNPFPKVLETSGDPATAPYTGFTVSNTDDPARPAVQEGWNLLGNPLSFGFDWDLATRTGGTTGAVYVFDPNYLGGNYRAWSAGIGGDLTDGVIPAFQGFFAKALASPATLEIPAAAVVDPSPATYGKADAGKSSESAPLRFELALADEPVSAAFVAAADGAALGLDRFDAFRLAPTAWPRTVLSTTVTDDDGAPVALALNALPADAAGEITVPVEVSAEGHTPGALALSLAWTGSLPEGWTAVLRDAATGAEVAVEPGASYGFELDVPAAREGGSADKAARPAGLGIEIAPPGFVQADALSASDPVSTGDRLTLVLRAPGATSTTPGSELAFGLAAPVPNPSAGLVRIDYALATEGAATVAVYDALGRRVAVLAEGEQPAGQHTATLDGRALAPGVYVVRLATAGGTDVRRITITR